MTSSHKTASNTIANRLQRKSAPRRAFSVPGRELCFTLFGYKPQSDAVIAVALTGRRRAVVEHVPVVTTAAHAMIFSARVKDLVVGARTENSRYGGEETRPASSALEFHRRSEERQATARADEDARSF